ncbi:MAG: alpha/beta fold hydrolase [Arenicellales bacterium]
MAQISVGSIVATVAAVTLVVFLAGGTATQAVCWALAGALATRIAPILSSFAVAYWPRADYHVPVLGARVLTRLIVRESWATLKLFFFYHPFEAMMTRHEPRGVIPGEMPVILVHGFFANAGFWHHIAPALRAAGWHNLFSINLEPPFAGIDSYARQLQERVEHACLRSGSDSVVIVAHSMGGLVARACARQAPRRIHRMICLGTPHHGTVMAWLVGWKTTRQMRPGSDWLRRLNIEGSDNERITNIFSEHDNIVVPQSSAALQGAKNVSVRAVGHLEMAFSPVLRRMLCDVLDQIEPAVPAR